MSTGLDSVLYIRPQGRGWAPVDAVATLTARLLEADLTVVDDTGDVSTVHKAAARIPRAPWGRRDRLIIAPNPAHLARVIRREAWLPGTRTQAAWVVDSFWTDRMAHAATTQHFDHIFIFDGDLQDEWRSRTRAEVSWLPWGTDCLAVDADAIARDRTVDVLRVGRQPEAYGSDEATIAAAAHCGLRAQGGPPFADSRDKDQESLRHYLVRARSLLAFSTRHDNSTYTHPTREYLTARWTDALGAGTLVAGSLPGCMASNELLWPSATIDLDPTDLDAGMRTLAAALADWTPDVALEQHRHARARLDWRHRLVTLCERLDLSAPACLEDEVARLGN